MSLKRIVIIGAGGFAREVKWLIDEVNRVSETYRFVGYVVSDTGNLGEHDSCSEVVGDLRWLAANCNREVDAAAIGIGTPAVRLKVAAEIQNSAGPLEWPALIHPTAQFDRASTRLGRGVILCAGVIGTVNLSFEDFCMCNLSCTIGHEAVIGSGSVLNPTVNISGGVKVGIGVLIGTGAQILQYVSLGDGCTVGAGGVVNKNVEAGVTVVGIPAKPLQRN